MSDNSVDFSQNKQQLDYASVKEACNTENKIWWNTMKRLYNKNYLQSFST